MKKNLSLVFKCFVKWLEESLWASQHSSLTLNKYQQLIENFITLLEAKKLYRLNDIDNAFIQKFITQKADGSRYSRATILVREAAIRVFSSWAFEAGYCREPFHLSYKASKLKHTGLGLKPRSTQPHQMDILTSKEQALLFSYLDDADDSVSIRDACIIALIMAMALYAHEISTLMIKGVDLKKKKITIFNEKGGQRVVPIDHDICLKLLAKWLKVRKKLVPTDFPLLFFTSRLNPISQRLLHHQIAQVLEKVGIHKKQNGSELLRQTAIARITENYDLKEAQKRVGHKHAISTEKYIRNE